MSQDAQLNDLVEAAKQVASRAYAPYSGFHVGAAVAGGGQIFSGCNIENASYGLTTCAERNAVAAAVAAGFTDLEAIAIYTDTDEPTPPCGACRQVLSEFNPKMKVYLACGGAEPTRFDLADLLPESFRFRGDKN